MREGTAHEYGVQHVRQVEVRHELPSPGQQTPILSTQKRAADERIGMAGHALKRRSRGEMAPQKSQRLAQIGRAFK